MGRTSSESYYLIGTARGISYTRFLIYMGFYHKMHDLVFIKRCPFHLDACHEGEGMAMKIFGHEYKTTSQSNDHSHLVSSPQNLTVINYIILFSL